MGKPVLVVEHEAQCPPGWLGEWLADAGAHLDVRRAYAGEQLPHDLTGHDGMLVLGGEMAADDDAGSPWLVDVRRLAAGAAQDGTPVLGVCLGHQLVAAALGGTVGPHAGGQQIGVLPVGWCDAAYDDELLGDLATRHPTAPAVHWNDDVVTGPPDGSVVLARTVDGAVQAASFAPRVWGVQWHPEVGAEIIGAWADHDRDAAQERGIDLDQHVGAVVAAQDRLWETWRPLADRFAAICHEIPR